MELRLNDYVRTEYGISKCIKVIPIKENSFMYEFDKEVYEDVNYLTASELEKYKSSPNIIDLIEVGDYVNGEKVGITIDTKELAIRNTGLIYDKPYNLIKDIDIKSIVTKEAYASVEYRVGTD